MLKWFARRAPAAATSAEDCKNEGNARLAEGKLDAAADCYRRALAIDPAYAEAHNNLGFVLLQQQRFDDAAQHLETAVRLKPSLANAHLNLGMLLLRGGRIDDALAGFEQAIASDPGNAEAHYGRGNVLYELERDDEALASLRHALALAPDHFKAHNCLGLVLQRQGHRELALQSYAAALAINPEFAIAHYNRGIALRLLGRSDEAADCFRQAVALQPRLAEAHYELGCLLRDGGQLEAAVQSYRKAIELNPHDASAQGELGTALYGQDRYGEALSCFDRAIALAPDMPTAHGNRSLVLRQMGRVADAVAAGEHAVMLAPESADAHQNLGLALQDMGKLDDAETCYRKALQLNAELGPTSFNLAVAALMRGHLAEGWRRFEDRFYPGSPAHQRDYPHPQWNGEDIRDKTLLIWGEQGVGDEIMFASLFNEAIARSARCVIECNAKLVPLFARSFPAAQIVPLSDPPHPATGDIDLQCAAGSLARWLRPDIGSFPPHARFLTPDARRVAHWRTRLAELGPGLKVGICWRSGLRSGARHLHYTRLDQWGPLFSVPGAHFVNLQYDDCAGELAAARTSLGVPLHAFEEVDLFNDLDESAALTQALDLVISAQTATAVLAGALDVPTWVLAYGTPWISLGTGRVPWFPAQRLFPRRWDQSWETVIATLAQALEAEMRPC